MGKASWKNQTWKDVYRLWSSWDNCMATTVGWPDRKEVQRFVARTESPGWMMVGSLII